METTDKEKEWGVLDDCRMTTSCQYEVAVKQLYAILMYTKYGAFSRDKAVLVPLYKALLRPHLEHHL